MMNELFAEKNLPQSGGGRKLFAQEAQDQEFKHSQGFESEITVLYLICE